MTMTMRPASTLVFIGFLRLTPLVSTEMNVELVVGQEVFGRQAEGITSQPHSGYPQWVTENIGHLSTLRQPPRLTARHTHDNTLLGEADFYPLLAQSG